MSNSMTVRARGRPTQRAPDPRQRTPGLAWWDSPRFHLCPRQGAGKQFPRLQVGSGKVALSRPTHQRVTQTVGLLFQKE